MVNGRKVTPTGILVAPAGLPEAEWLELRRRGIGGSDIAALLGMNRYTSPYELYLDKRGELPAIPQAAALERAARWGHLHEPLLAAEFARAHGVKVRRVGMVRHEHEPWMLASIDRQVLGCEDGPCLLEIKNRSAWKASDWGPSGSSDGVPDTECLQTHWYMCVTGYRHAHVAVLINGNDDRYYRVSYDPELADDVVAMARDFWRRVRDGDPPPVDGSQAVTELLSHLWEAGEGDVRVVSAAEVAPLCEQRARIKAQIKVLEEQLAGTENQLKMMLGDAETAVCDGKPLFTWKRNGPFSVRQFTHAHPDLAAKYEHLVPVLDTQALAAGHPEIFRAFRARVLRVNGGNH